jgi:predicted secreted protein
MTPVLGAAIYIILWWLAFFLMLPIGVRNHDEAGVETPAGVERAAPARPKLWWKALWAALLAGVLWLGVFLAVRADLFAVRG